MATSYKHVVVFTKPKFSRDKGLIRLCRNDPNHRFKTKTIESADTYINEDQYKYHKKYKHSKQSMPYYGIIPIMYLSEWKSSSNDYKKCFSQSLCRGFPRLQIISHKGNLANLLNKHYAKDQALKQNKLFYPRTYVLPKEKQIFIEENECKFNGDDNVKFIVKPQGKSKGNGIFLVSQYSDINFEQFVIVQSYISNPLLIKSHKFDLRLYVFIASINPLQIYLYDRGLVRFASSEYSKCIDINQENDEILCSHLTNFSLNKKHSAFKDQSKEIKWSLNDFWSYLEANGQKKKREHIMEQIESMIANVFKIGYDKLNEGFLFNFSDGKKNDGRCFDILGMDVLVDTNYKCWLMEFNRYPSLKCTHKVDEEIKYDLCNDLFEMLKPRIVCNQRDNIMYHHKMPIILNPKGTGWKRVL